LSPDPGNTDELSLRSEEEPFGPLADLKLSDVSTPAPTARPPLGTLDLDRILGAPPAPATDLPLFTEGSPVDERPLVTPSAPRTPLAVRRATPETPRLRSRSVKVEIPTLDLDSPHEAIEGEAPVVVRRSPIKPDAEPARETVKPAGPFRRIVAAAIDLGILAAINAVVIYFTLRLSQLPIERLGALPWAPLGSFLLLLAAGYFVVFTAVGGQTIGKMAVGTRVTSQEGPVDVPHAVLRFAGGLLTLLTCGLGYLPAFFGVRRALHDRLAGTDVVRMPPH
jgi:uncharacterized RDD family membrane protein YckC